MSGAWGVRWRQWRRAVRMQRCTSCVLRASPGKVKGGARTPAPPLCVRQCRTAR
nr:hypothetical protein RVX_1759 [Nitratidesulfovibrio sp. HK-II]